MAKKKEKTEIVRYRCLNSRGLRLSMPVEDGRQKHIMFRNSVFFTSDPKIIDFLDNHPCNLMNVAESGKKPSHARADDVESATAAEHKAVKTALKDAQSEAKELKKAVIEKNNLIRSLKARMRKEKVKYSDIDNTDSEDAEDIDGIDSENAEDTDNQGDL